MTSAQAKPPTPDQLSSSGKWREGRQCQAGGSPGHTPVGLDPSFAYLTREGPLAFLSLSVSSAKQNDALQGLSGGSRRVITHRTPGGVPSVYAKSTRQTGARLRLMLCPGLS